MALLAASTTEVRFGAGADTNGAGCSNAAATNLSLFNAAQYAQTDIVTAGTTTITSALSNWGTDVVDNWIYIAGGTGSIAPNWYRIVTRNSASSLVLDRSTGLTTGTGATGNVGGALATIGGLGALIAAGGVAGMVAWVKAGTNTLTSATNNISGGTFNNANLDGIGVFGYSASRGDLNDVIGSVSRPVIDAGAIATMTMITGAAQRTHVANIKIDGQGNANVIGFGSVITTNCTAQDCTTGFSATIGTPILCSAIGCGTGFSGHYGCAFCFTNDSTVAGYDSAITGYTLVNCVSINDAIGVSTATRGTTLINCTIHEASGDGLGGMGVVNRFINTIFTNNVSDAIDFTNATTAPTTAYVLNCAFRGNGAVYETSPPAAQIAGSITLTADPYTSEATDDLVPNNTAGGGAELRGASIGVYGQTEFRDLGAVESGLGGPSDPPSGGGGGRILSSSIIAGLGAV